MMFPRFGAKLMFINYNVWSIRIRIFLGECNLWQDVITNLEKCILEKNREMKEKRTREILQGVMHEKVQMRVAGYDFLPQLWNVLEFVCNNYNGPSLPKSLCFWKKMRYLQKKLMKLKKKVKMNFFEDIYYLERGRKKDLC